MAKEKATRLGGFCYLMSPRGLLAARLPLSLLVPHCAQDRPSDVFRERCSLTEPRGVL